MLLQDSHCIVDCGSRGGPTEVPLRDVRPEFDAGHREHLVRSETVEGRHLPTAILVEHRDGAFDRLAFDLVETGWQVLRAESATEALQLCGRHEPYLVLANIDLPDQSGWLLAGKMQFVDRRIRIWLYQIHSTKDDEAMADFLQIDHLLDYGGDVLGLSKTIVSLANSTREAHAHPAGITTGEERTTA